MNELIDRVKTARAFMIILVAVLLLSFHYFFIYFINSTYLNGVLGERSVGFVYTIGAFLNISLFLIAPKILRSYGNYKLTIGLTIIEAISLIGLALSTSGVSVIAFFLLHQAVGPLLLYTMDIFLEKYAETSEMGSIRGMYLTMLNIPPIITPFIVGLILTKPDYWKVYFISAIFLIPFTLIIISYFKSFKDQHYPIIDAAETARHFFKNKQVFDVFVDQFLLHFFYGWMVIYMPIYLHQHIGFSWSEIGVMFSIMLLPFLFFQIPVGKFEDTYHNEKQVLELGFLIMAIACMIIPFITVSSFVLWTGILFISRIGASLVEVSSESFFFKHIKASNAGFISFFRMTRSLPYLISPAIVSVALLFIDIRYIFVILGLIMLVGIRYASLLRNTR